ncbi:MAG: TIM barrel protein [Gemmataceae bacterium]|nr:TIM barrel protein [Gemmataceae bacterium]
MKSNRRKFLAATGALSAGVALAGNVLAGDDNSRLGRTPHTRFAVNVEMWWNKLPFLQRIEQTAALGFPAIEFWPWQGKDINAIAQLCRKLKIEVAQFTAWGFRPGLNDPKNHQLFVKDIEAGCKVAEQLDCRLMTVVAGDDVRGMTQRQMHDNVIAGLRLGAPIAEKHGVTLILEPMNIRVDHKGHCLYGSESTMRIIKEVNSRFVKINWDLYHMQISEGDLCGHLDEGFAANAIGYIQIADHPGRNEPGTGEVHYTRVLQQLERRNYRGIVGLELRPRKTELEAARAVNRADQW